MNGNTPRERYELFKLQWMLSHGYTLKDLFTSLESYLDGDLVDSYDLTTLLDMGERECGFAGSSIYPCFEEWLVNEGQEVWDEEVV